MKGTTRVGQAVGLRFARAGAAVVAFAVAGCTLAPTLGEQCVFGCQVKTVSTPDGDVNICTPELRPCADPYYCSAQTNNCERPAARGEPCGEQCAKGLVCRFDGICEAPGTDGKPCLADADCVDGLVCNFGVEPRDPQRHGRCKPLQPDGGPCWWFAWPSDNPAAETAFRGCQRDLVCHPVGHVLPEDLPQSAPPPCRGDKCGHPGTCGQAGLAARGAPCVDHRGCMTGRCMPLPFPSGAKADPRFWCEGGASGRQPCYAAPWPGVCIDDEDLRVDEVCRKDFGVTKDCVPPLVCTRQWGCQTPHSFAPGSRCALGLGPEPVVCGVGLECRMHEGYETCL